MKRISLRTWLAGAVLGVALAMTLSCGVSYAESPKGCPKEGDAGACSGSEHYMVTGAAPSSSGEGENKDGKSAPPTAGSVQLGGNSGPSAAGELIYDDFKAVEKRARGLLLPNLKFREDISPYRKNNKFDELVRKFDTAGGFDAVYGPTITTAYSETLTLGGRINQADKEFREARDLYAYLLTFAPDRFRTDDYYTGAPPSGFQKALCAEGKSKEDLNPADPNYTGLVLDPVIDWCDFPARLRQAVRESVNIRMIFGQQYMVDALGLHFSGVEFVGGEKFVRDEVAKLRVADHQYKEAEIGLQEAMTHTIGSGCVVSDYYTQTEWALLSRAAESQETA